MRYEVQPAPYAKWQVYDRVDSNVIGWDLGLSEAEANIIAFALNAVAEGHTLGYLLPGGGFMPYYGPTDGVAS